MNLLQNRNKMCYDEFKKLFCKDMFKTALINTINKLKDGTNEEQMQTGTGSHKDSQIARSDGGSDMASVIRHKLGESVK